MVYFKAWWMHSKSRWSWRQMAKCTERHRRPLILIPALEEGIPWPGRIGRLLIGPAEKAVSGYCTIHLSAPYQPKSSQATGSGETVWSLDCFTSSSTRPRVGLREMGSVITDQVFWGRAIGPPKSVLAEIPSSKRPRYCPPCGTKHRQGFRLRDRKTRRRDGL
jgi:hypothetical protein